MSVTEAAWGILTVLATNVIAAMRTITIERGYDPREFTLVPFGGMGPTIAGRIAGELGITRMLIPPDPGTFSAYGMLVTDVHQTRSLTRLTQVGEVDADGLDRVFGELEDAAQADLVRDRFPRESLRTIRSAGMRYRGQSYEVSVPVAALRSADDVAALVGRFHDAHRRRYGHMAENEAVEIVNFQVTAVAALPRPPLRRYPRGDGSPAQPRTMRGVHLGSAEPVHVPVFHRSDLAPGAEINGPAVVEEKTSTLVLYAGQTARIDEYLNIAIAVAA